MPTTCCVVNCRSRGGRDNVQFFRIPSGLQFPHKPQLNELSKIRRARWIHAINRQYTTELTVKYSRVCSKHFITGKPAELIDENNPDWVPSLLMGYGEDAKRVIKRVAINAARQERAEKRMKLDEQVLEVAAEITEETNTSSRDLQHDTYPQNST